MHLDVRDLRSFYYRTALGRAAQKAVRDQVVNVWPAAKGETVVGFGFAVPVLRPFLADARRVIALMPGPQGVMPWPAGQPNVSVLSEETLWPIQTGQADKLILLHGLETSENANAVLRESYRVLGPGGRALFIVPNRAGLWSSNENTPFGFGRPYSLGQLEAQLKDFDFIPQRHVAALFQPPTEQRFWMRTGNLLERAGRSITGRFAGGVLMVEAKKQVPAKAGGSGVAVRRRSRVLEGLGAPAPEPARRVPRDAAKV
ncbi:class I SAM-dependent methyltransferase [Maribius pontilimi]|uniref:Class I SAM-dependent methyltransferase n=1 Tax=Palleronia pontilimi TaxID=1964209 RepID=A0A934IAC9_9RHOB|nr:class I SAM-dependent methyltransferase [Palleronia pontilimi]MBJ3763403.1 class I SAM-dependent methyltransferase [Palleronia pontilimi]